MTKTPRPQDVRWEHDTIRKQLKFLTDSMSGLAAKSNEEIEQTNQLKDKITLYRWSLYDFREAVRRHIDQDERIFEQFLGSVPNEGLYGEHKSIQKQLDKAISLAENAVYNNLSEEEMKKCALDLRKAVNKLCKSIRAHTAKEDKLLEQS